MGIFRARLVQMGAGSWEELRLPEDGDQTEEYLQVIRPPEGDSPSHCSGRPRCIHAPTPRQRIVCIQSDARTSRGPRRRTLRRRSPTLTQWGRWQKGLRRPPSMGKKWGDSRKEERADTSGALLVHWLSMA